jgi:fatty acid desaturase
MIPLTALWLPILLSVVIVFFASAIMHMVLSYHKSDYRKLPDEDRVTDALRSAGVTPGPAYFFPYFSFKEM